MNIRNIARLAGLTLGLCASALAFTAEGDAPSQDRQEGERGAPRVAAETIVLRCDHASARVLGDLIKQYEASKLGKVELQPFSTISGLDAVHSGTADLAGSARAAMPDREEEQGTNFYPMAWYAMVPIVVAENPVSNISLKQLNDLYLGRLTNWRDLGGADAEIGIDGVAPPLDGVEYSTRLLLFHYGDQVFGAAVVRERRQAEEDIALNAHGVGLSTLSTRPQSESENAECRGRAGVSRDDRRWQLSVVRRDVSCSAMTASSMTR